MIKGPGQPKKSDVPGGCPGGMGGWGQNNLTGALLDYYHWNELEVEAYKGTIYKHRAIQKKRSGDCGRAP